MKKGDIVRLSDSEDKKAVYIGDKLYRKDGNGGIHLKDGYWFMLIGKPKTNEISSERMSMDKRCIDIKGEEYSTLRKLERKDISQGLIMESIFRIDELEKLQLKYKESISE